MPRKRNVDEAIKEVQQKKRAHVQEHETAHMETGETGGAFTFEKMSAAEDLTISPIPSSKDKIQQPPLAKDENMYIPPLGSSVIMCGKSGCGKSTLLANLFRDGRFYGKSKAKPKGWFDKVFIFSPTANGDDVQKSLGIDKKHVFTNLEEAPDLLEVILDSQQDKIDDSDGADKVEQFAIIFDDVIGDVHFMNDKNFSRCFYQVRHVNCTTFICSQHFKRIPRVCRQQANFIFFFEGSSSEVETVVDEYAPPQYSKNEMREMVTETTRDNYAFLTINMKVGWDKRFRRNLDEFIRLPRIAQGNDDEKEEKYAKREKEDEADSDEERDTNLEDAIEEEDTQREAPNKPWRR